jgi:hypothetical protein
VLVGGDAEDRGGALAPPKGSAALDIVDHNPPASPACASASRPFAAQVRFVEQDPNFLTLDAGAYDAALVGGGIGRVVNLEYLFDELALGLRPGGPAGGCRATSASAATRSPRRASRW